MRLWMYYSESEEDPEGWTTPWSLGTYLWALLHGYYVELMWGW